MRASEQAEAVTTQEGFDRVLRVYYSRPDRVYQGWGLHVWGDGVRSETSWAEPLLQNGQDSDGCFWDVQLRGSGPAQVGIIVHRGDEKSAVAALRTIEVESSELWLVADCPDVFFSRDAVHSRPSGSLAHCQAHWVTPDTVLWRQPSVDDNGAGPRAFKLFTSASAGLKITNTDVLGADAELPLSAAPPDERFPVALLSKFPHLNGCTVLRLPDLSPEEVQSLVRSQLCVGVFAADGTLIHATGIQFPGTLDCRFRYDGPLGDAYGMVNLWAPTAQKVELLRYTSAQGGEPEVHEMDYDSATGVWSLMRPPSWDKQFYQYRVTVYHHDTQQLEVLVATDPYSRGLSADGERTMFLDLDTDESLYPSGWRAHLSPPIKDVMDTSVYELHVRDFSACDESVPSELRGKYLAFDASATGTGTQGQAHLKRLQAAGLTHVHLLPSYDFGSVPEKTKDQLEPPINLHEYAADSDAQQQEIMKVASADNYNWGYDPVHYGVPEGSYATDPDSPDRIKEYRSMVKALHDMGLRVVLDVVYNHTFASGLNQHSVLDKVVPGYYHRRIEDGDICNSTCCNNTATEHYMCERLMVDDLVHWARHYRVDGFRFDIMGHILVSSMQKARDALDKLTIERDGVDGKSIYIYGEAWDFGEMTGNQRGRNACQLNITGTGLGAFNDRARDGGMGGSPFAPPSMQGFLTGLYTEPNNITSTKDTQAQDLDALGAYTDWLKLGMAGNLREYQLLAADGQVKAGKLINIGPVPVAYCGHPSENVMYMSCHDNETLFDQVLLKLEGSTSIEEKVRLCQLALGVIAVSQGIAFFHAGDDLLRSKSLDRDSYNSGDWFNKLDWSGQTNNFGVGLPPAGKNASSWPLKKLLLGNPNLKPTPQLIAQTHEFFQAMLRVRYSTRLFRLPTAEAICNQVSFGDGLQEPGVILMRIAWGKEAVNGDEPWKSVLVVINASPQTRSVAFPAAVSGKLSVHPAMQSLPHVKGSVIDGANKSLSIQGRTILVACEE